MTIGVTSTSILVNKARMPGFKVYIDDATRFRVVLVVGAPLVAP